MDYRFLTQKTLSLINAGFILLFFSTNISAFETNSDSKITANLEVTGALKLGSVDASSNGIVTSISDSSNSTIPTTGAVKAYIDTQLVTNPDSIIATTVEVTGALKLGSVDSSSAGVVTSIADSSNSTLPTTGAVKAYIDAQVAGSSGGYPSEFCLFTDKPFTPGICKDANYSWSCSRNDWRLPTLGEVLNLETLNHPRYIWTTDVGFEKDHYIAVNVVSGSVDSFDRTSLGSGDGYNLNHVCVR